MGVHLPKIRIFLTETGGARNVYLYVGEFRKIFSKKALIPRRHAPSLGTFSSKKMARCKYYQECFCRGALCRNCNLACRFLPPFRDRSLWVANFEYSRAKERLSQGTKVFSPSSNDLFLDLGLLQVSPNRRVLGYLSLRYLILVLPKRCPSLTSTRIARAIRSANSR